MDSVGGASGSQEDIPMPNISRMMQIRIEHFLEWFGRDACGSIIEIDFLWFFQQPA
jgi:hypothetical protein